MFIQPWDAALDEAEWRTWIAGGHDFGTLSVNGPPGRPPVAVPTHFTADGNHLLVHLARPNPVWQALENDPNVLFTVFGDYAFVPGPWRAAPAARPPTASPPATTRPSSSPAAPTSSTTPRPRPSCCAASSPTSSPTATTPPSPPTGPLRPDVARHPRPAPGGRRGTGQVQVRRPQARRAPHRRRRPPHRPGPGPRRPRRAPAAPPPGPHRPLEALTPPGTGRTAR